MLNIFNEVVMFFNYKISLVSSATLLSLLSSPASSMEQDTSEMSEEEQIQYVTRLSMAEQEKTRASATAKPTKEKESEEQLLKEALEFVEKNYIIGKQDYAMSPVNALIEVQKDCEAVRNLFAILNTKGPKYAAEFLQAVKPTLPGGLKNAMEQLEPAIKAALSQFREEQKGAEIKKNAENKAKAHKAEEPKDISAMSFEEQMKYALKLSEEKDKNNASQTYVAPESNGDFSGVTDTDLLNISLKYVRDNFKYIGVKDRDMSPEEAIGHLVNDCPAARVLFTRIKSIKFEERDLYLFKLLLSTAPEYRNTLKILQKGLEQHLFGGRKLNITID